jgi:hypothetical protein
MEKVIFPIFFKGNGHATVNLIGLKLVTGISPGWYSMYFQLGFSGTFGLLMYRTNNTVACGTFSISWKFRSRVSPDLALSSFTPPPSAISALAQLGFVCVEFQI